MSLAIVPILAMCFGGLNPGGVGTQDNRLVERTRGHLVALAKNDGLSGVVLIAKAGKPIFEQAFGFANLADRVPNRTNTKFNMASMGKMVTGVAVMQLVEAGKVSLQAKVGKYLPDYPNKAVREQVTIEQLLTHTSGMGNFWKEISDKAKERYSAVSDYVPLFADQPLQFEPGKGFAYSNNGYTVLGLVIEAASGQSYFDYVKSHVYRPCGMTDTDAYELNVPIGRMAIGYSRVADSPGKIVSNFYVNVYKGSPAGGSYTTAQDLLRFANALTQHKLLNKANTEILTRGKVDYGTRRYAYGFSDETVNGHRLIGHSGGSDGIANELMIFTDLGYTVVILTNGDVENFWDVQTFVKRELMGSSRDTDNYYFTKKLIDTAVAKGYEAGVALLKNATGSPATRSGVFEQIGYKLLWQGKTNPAIDVFRLYAHARPNDAYAYLGLGKAYERARNKTAAVEAYRHYLTIEPDDDEIKLRLQKLGSQ